MHNEGGAHGRGGMYPPPPSRGGEFGRGDQYGYYGGSGYGGHPAQGYGGGMGVSCVAYGATEVGPGSSSVLEDQLLCTLTPTDSRALLPSPPRTEVDTAAEVAVLTTCPYGGFAMAWPASVTWNGYEQRRSRVR